MWGYHRKPAEWVIAGRSGVQGMGSVPVLNRPQVGLTHKRPTLASLMSAQGA